MAKNDADLFRDVLNGAMKALENYNKAIEKEAEKLKKTGMADHIKEAIKTFDSMADSAKNFKKEMSSELKKVGASAGYAVAGQAGANIGAGVGGIVGGVANMIVSEIAGPFISTMKDGANVLRESYANAIRVGILEGTTLAIDTVKAKQQKGDKLAGELGIAAAYLPQDQLKQLLSQEYQFAELETKGRQNIKKAENELLPPEEVAKQITQYDKERSKHDFLQTFYGKSNADKWTEASENMNQSTRDQKSIWQSKG